MKKFFSKSFLVTLFVLCFFYFTINTYGQVQSLFDPQTGLPIGITEQISVQILPSIPKPGQTVTISLQNFSSDFDKANFVWTINNEVAEEGTGIKNFSFTAPQAGQTINIGMTAFKEEGGTIVRNFSFSPADVEIIQEADTYTPPFYKGKALLTSEATARLIAIPDFGSQSINPSSLIYTWSINGKVDQAGSGYGKQTYEYNSGLIQRDFEIMVEVSAINSELNARDSIFVNYSEPDVVLYERNPALGVVFNRAIQGNFLLAENEIELQAIPYNFTTPQKNSSFIDYIWKQNGVNIFSSSDSSIVFRNDTGEAGRALISLTVEHFNNILQVNQTSLNLNFEKNEENIDNNSGF